jgi:hypothetical protein
MHPLAIAVTLAARSPLFAPVWQLFGAESFFHVTLSESGFVAGFGSDGSLGEVADVADGVPGPPLAAAPPPHAPDATADKNSANGTGNRFFARMTSEATTSGRSLTSRTRSAGDHLAKAATYPSGTYVLQVTVDAVSETVVKPSVDHASSAAAAPNANA